MLLNYHSKKREVKRAKKEAKRSSKKGRRGRREEFGSPGPSNQETDPSTSDDNRGNQADDESSSDDNAATQNANDRNRPEESCWTKVPDTEDKTREEEFDDYLADLLL